MSSHNGLTKVPVSGTIYIVGVEPPGRTLETPGDICHMWEFVEYVRFTGDVEGDLTYTVHSHGPCERNRFTAMGPFKGEVTWNGRTGPVSGQFTTNCKPDPDLGAACDGVSTFRGSGDLEGVHFKIEWGPGLISFPYSGTAYAK
ncbi:MAG: hypothetical protein R3224_06055 [Balneolaceae bacterium]|nr:hypothetical protein [Balneolaceae bacterium]